MNALSDKRFEGKLTILQPPEATRIWWYIGPEAPADGGLLAMYSNGLIRTPAGLIMCQCTCGPVELPEPGAPAAPPDRPTIVPAQT